jgi:methyl-accepting chemotaxis protein
MTIKKASSFISILTILVIIITATLLVILNRKIAEFSKTTNDRFYCNILAAEFRNHSDELTRQVQLYCVTGNASAEDAYNHVLDVLDGEMPRPANALVAPGEKWVFLELLRKYGITDEEFAHVDQANDYSENLVVLEIEAMSAVKGLYQDAYGEYTVEGEPDMELARNLVFGDAYWLEVGKIMSEIDKFQYKVNERTEKAMKKAEAGQRTAELASTVVLAIVLLIVIINLLFNRIKMLKPIQILRDILKDIAQGEGDVTKTISINSKDEVGDLARYFNQTMEKIKNL